MAHAHHFLERLDRVPRSQIDFALSLYRDPDLVRWVCAYARLAEGEDRIALSIAGAGGPYVIVTRDGHFVTALAEGMSTGTLRVLTRSQVDAFAARVRDARRRRELAREIAPPGKDPADVIALINRRPGHLSREEVTAIGGWNAFLWKSFFRGVFDCAKEVDRSLPVLLSTKVRSRQRDALAEATWHQAHSIGARWLFTTMGDLAWVEPVMAKWTDDFAPTAMATQQRLFSVAIRGWWAAARMGKHVLPLYKNAMHGEQASIGLFDAALGATAIGLRHARCVPEVKRILEMLPAAAGPASAEWSKTIVDRCMRALDEPEAALETPLTFGRMAYGGLSRIVAPAGSPHRVERDEDVTREQALLATANHDGDCMTLLAVDLLPWAARLPSPEDFYFPEETERAMRLAVIWERIAPWTERLREDYITPTPSLRAPARPGRNDPCSCGSGAKYKKCCGR